MSLKETSQAGQPPESGENYSPLKQEFERHNFDPRIVDEIKNWGELKGFPGGFSLKIEWTKDGEPYSPFTTLTYWFDKAQLIILITNGQADLPGGVFNFIKLDNISFWQHFNPKKKRDEKNLKFVGRKAGVLGGIRMSVTVNQDGFVDAHSA